MVVRMPLIFYIPLFEAEMLMGSINLFSDVG